VVVVVDELVAASVVVVVEVVVDVALAEGRVVVVVVVVAVVVAGTKATGRYLRVARNWSSSRMVKATLMGRGLVARASVAHGRNPTTNAPVATR